MVKYHKIFVNLHLKFKWVSIDRETYYIRRYRPTHILWGKQQPPANDKVAVP